MLLFIYVLGLLSGAFAGLFLSKLPLDFKILNFREMVLI